MIWYQTAQAYSKEIAGKGSGTVFWNGPMGMFEQFRYANGTVSVAKSIALAFWRGSTTLVGGGDTLEAMKFGGVSESEVSHVSTGGGSKFAIPGRRRDAWNRCHRKAINKTSQMYLYRLDIKIFL